MSDCHGDHLNFSNETCPDCGEEVDAYGNTESSFQYCSFPDCGCDGARLCMAGEASDHALKSNVEGMWTCSTPAQRKAVADLMAGLSDREGDSTDA